MKPEVHVFVVWPFAMSARERILKDVAKRTEIIAQVEACWPVGVSPDAGYRRFYGANLPDAVGKVKRAGEGKFLIVIVRIASPRYDWRMTQRGLELVNLDMFEMKWQYREWVGGLHRVHGTNSVREARRDVMLLTGFSIDDWESGKALSDSINVLPGQNGWRDVSEMFSFLNEVHPYVILRNEERLHQNRLDPSHDIDVLAENAKECASALNVEGSKKSGTVRFVQIGGHRMKIDICDVNDGYFDEVWSRHLLGDRVLNDDDVYVLPPESELYSLLYHLLYRKRRLTPYYRKSVPSIASKIGIEISDFNSLYLRVEKYMQERGYQFSTPSDAASRLNPFRINWRKYACEATELFSLSDVRPVFDTPYALEMVAVMNGTDVRVIYSPEISLISRDYDLQLKMHEKASSSVAQPIMWHVGVRGAYLVLRKSEGKRMREILDAGSPFAPEVIVRITSEIYRLVTALDAAKVVHRNIDADSVWVSPDGSLMLEGFGFGVDRKKYKTEAPYFRRKIASRLIPLGGANVPRPARWNDRLALANLLLELPETEESRKMVSRLKDEVASGIGELKLAVRKLRFRLIQLYLEIFVRGIVSARRRKSDAFKRIRSFVRNSL